MTPGFDPTQVDWNNPDVEYLMKNFERAMADRRDEIVLLTKSNNQLASGKEQMASKNMELEERCLHLEAKYDKLIEMYNELRDGAGVVPSLGVLQKIQMPDPGLRPSNTPETARRSSYNVRKFTGYPRPKSTARSEDNLPRRDHVVHEMMTADELVCRTCGSTLSRPTATYSKTTEDLINYQWQETVWEITRRYCKKCRRQQTALTDGVLPNEHYGINIMAQTATLRCMVDSFVKIHRLFRMFHGVRIPKSTLNHFCDKVASELDPLYQQIKRDLNTGRLVNGDTTGWFINGQGRHVWVFVGKDTDGKASVLFEIDESAGKKVPMAVLEDLRYSRF